MRQETSSSRLAENAVYLLRRIKSYRTSCRDNDRAVSPDAIYSPLSFRYKTVQERLHVQEMRQDLSLVRYQMSLLRTKYNVSKYVFLELSSKVNAITRGGLSYHAQISKFHPRSSRAPKILF